MLTIAHLSTAVPPWHHGEGDQDLGMSASDDAHVSTAAPPSGAVGETTNDRAKKVLERLQTQWQWYDKYARRNRLSYLTVKIIQLVLAAAVPVAASIHAPIALTGSLGA